LELSDDERVIASFLTDRGYDRIQDWAIASGYFYDDDCDVWYNDDGYGVDLEDELILGIDRGTV